MNRQYKALGVFGLWLYVRIVEVFIWVFALMIEYTFVRVPGKVGLTDALILLLLVYVSFLMHPVAYGSADKNGIYYRRYLKKHFASWEQLDGVEWRVRSFRPLAIYLKGMPRWRGTLTFGQNPSVRSAYRQFWGRETPEIVVWLQAQLASAERR